MSGGVLETIPDDELEGFALDRPVASLYDVAYLYGQIYSRVAVEQVEGDVDAEYVPFMTPDSEHITALYEQENSLLSVLVDLSGEEPTLPDDFIRIERLTWQKAIRAGYARPQPKRGPIIAHSIPHHANGKDAETTAGYAVDRLTRWPTDSDVSDVADEYDESIIQQLRLLGEDESVTDRIKTEVKTRVKQLGGSFDGLVSLRIKLPGDDDYRYPGEIEEVNAGMAAKKTERMAAYSSADDSSGSGTDYVTDARDVTVLGATPGSPADYFHGKQLEKFPDLDPDAGWQRRPLAAETANAVAASNPYIESCTVYFGGGVEIRYLPYVDGVLSASDIRQLATLLDALLNGDRNVATVIRERLQEFSTFAERLRLYQIVTATELGWKDKVIDEQPNVRALRAVEIADQHIATFDTWPFAAEGWKRVFPTSSDGYSGLLDRENTSLPEQILSGQYFRETLHDPQRNSEDPVFGPDDIRLACLTALVGGEQLPRDALVGSYVRRIIEEQNDLFGDSDRDAEFPHFLVTSQYVQLSALAASGAFETTTVVPAINYDTATRMVDSITSREEKLEQFIEDHPLLDDDEERQAAFVLGAFVGRLSAYQMQDEVSTMLSRFPVDSVTKRKIPRIANKVIGKNNAYSDKEGLGLMNMRYQSRLSDLLNRTDPTEWDLSTDELRLHYALGIAYGYRDTSDDDESDDAEADSSPTDDQPQTAIDP